MSMGKDEQNFSVHSWWAGSAEFVLYSLSSQLKAAAVVFPELAEFEIGVPENKTRPLDDPPPEPSLTAGERGHD